MSFNNYWTILTTLLIIGFFGVLLGWLFRKLQTESNQVSLENLIEKVNGDKILAADNFANFYGQESKGFMQLRGNGNLAISDKEIYFKKFLSKQEFHIPFSSITSVEIAKWHLGKSNGKPLLKVSYKNENNEPDSISWSGRDVYGYKEIIEANLATN